MSAPLRIVEQPTRHRFTANEVSAMVEAGVIDREGRMELLDGELIDMPSEGERHIHFKIELNRFFVKAISDELRVAPDASLHLAAVDVPEPDLYVLDTGAALRPVDPAQVRLVVEIADSSLSYDLGPKSATYARYGVGEYWVLDIGARVTHVLKRPADGVYQDVAAVAFDQPLRPERVAGIALVIAGRPGRKLG